MEEGLSARLQWAAKVSPAGSMEGVILFREGSLEGPTVAVLDTEDLSEDFMAAASDVAGKIVFVRSKRREVIV